MPLRPRQTFLARWCRVPALFSGRGASIPCTNRAPAGAVADRSVQQPPSICWPTWACPQTAGTAAERAHRGYDVGGHPMRRSSTIVRPASAPVPTGRFVLITGDIGPTSRNGRWRRVYRRRRERHAAAGDHRPGATAGLDHRRIRGRFKCAPSMTAATWKRRSTRIGR